MLTTAHRKTFVALWLAALLLACSSERKPVAAAGSRGGAGATADNGGSGGSAEVKVEVDSGTPVTDSGPRTYLDAGATSEGTTDAKTALQKLPELEHVSGVTTSDTVAISFLPFDGARDYRVYELPADGQIVTAGGVTHVRNAIYRCAGMRERPNTVIDGAADKEALGSRTLVDNQDVDGYRRALSEAQLGYVYYAAGENRAPVYALGDPHAKADNWAFPGRFTATRAKRYTSAEATRKELLASGWRDDGVAFYVPTRESADTQNIYTALHMDGHTRYYFSDGAEKSKRTGAELAFPVLKSAAKGAEALYRVFQSKYQAFAHDELVVGKTMFERVRYQGSEQPVTQLTWSGLTGPTTLVVEALDRTCPYPGRLAAQPIAERTESAATESGTVTYPRATTLDEARDAAEYGEVFINGQSAAGDAPKAIARAFLRVAPQPNEQFDFFADFAPGKSLPMFNDVDCVAPDGNCFQKWRERSSEYDVQWHTIVTGEHAMGSVLGELWVRYADWAADTNGKFRIAPLQKGKVTDDKYLHATMEVTAISTGRRYPQLIVSDRDAPVQDYFPMGNTIIVQVFRFWPNYLELQICDHRVWDVNNQCPFFQFYERRNAAGETTSLAPVDEMGELTGADVRTRFDLFLSSKRAYVLVNRKPFGCVELPASGIPTGDVTITFGDVLYHSAADSPLGYHKEFLPNDTERRFDNLGFSSGVGAPSWDSTRFPCVAASSIDIHR